MSENTFSAELRELYDGELLGEAFFESLLQFYEDRTQKRKLYIALQLESETKTRLRPFLLDAGLELNDNGEARKTGYDLAQSFKGKSWEDAMNMLLQILQPAVERYRQILAKSPSRHRELAASMLEHEEALFTFVELEIAGKGTESTRAMSSQLTFEIPMP